jgi:hypothetical protein
MTRTMTTLKILTAAMLLSSAVAAPALAKDRLHHEAVRRAYNQVVDPSYAAPASPGRVESFGSIARDPSRIGGYDPSFSPSGS